MRCLACAGPVQAARFHAACLTFSRALEGCFFFCAFCNIAFNCFHFSNVLNDNALHIQSAMAVLSYDKRTKKNV